MTPTPRNNAAFTAHPPSRQLLRTAWESRHRGHRAPGTGLAPRPPHTRDGVAIAATTRWGHCWDLFCRCMPGTQLAPWAHLGHICPGHSQQTPHVANGTASTAHTQVTAPQGHGQHACVVPQPPRGHARPGMTGTAGTRWSRVGHGRASTARGGHSCLGTSLGPVRAWDTAPWGPLMCGYVVPGGPGCGGTATAMPRTGSPRIIPCAWAGTPGAPPICPPSPSRLSLAALRHLPAAGGRREGPGGSEAAARFLGGGGGRGPGSGVHGKGRGTPGGRGRSQDGPGQGVPGRARQYRLCRAVPGWAELCRAVPSCAGLCQAVPSCARLC